MGDAPVLEVDDLVKHFPAGRGLLGGSGGTVHAVDGVSFALREGEMLGLVGESGSAFQQPWGTIMAATIIITVPLVALVLVFQRFILAGLTAGAVKG